MTGIIFSNDGSDLFHTSDESNFDDDATSTTETYTEGYSRTSNRKGKGQVRKW